MFRRLIAFLLWAPATCLLLAWLAADAWGNRIAAWLSVVFGPSDIDGGK